MSWSALQLLGVDRRATTGTPTAGDRADRDGVPIAEVAASTGLSRDTLRWYEREGLLPPVARGGDGRRRYRARDVALLQVLVRLRRTGMPVERVRRFSRLMAGGAATHGVRMALLLDHRTAVLQHIEALHADLAVLGDKIDHYRSLIDAGLDCDGAPVDAATAVLQRSPPPRREGPPMTADAVPAHAVLPASHLDLLERPLFGHLRAPQVALSIHDPEQPYRYLEVRGLVEQIDPDPDGAFFDVLARRYGLPYTPPVGDAAHRVVLRVRPTGSSAQ